MSVMEVLFISVQKFLLQVFFIAWLHSSCSMAHRPVELSRKLMTKPCGRPCAALCRQEQVLLWHGLFGKVRAFCQTIACGRGHRCHEEWQKKGGESDEEMEGGEKGKILDI